jgi:spermidine/putrescine transport system substrate-binding protein
MRKSVSLLSLLTILPTTSFCLSSCSANAIVIANYESYMNTLLINRLHKSHNVQFDYYQTNEQIVGKFAKNYDIAFPSSYTVYEMIKNNLVAKLD